MSVAHIVAHGEDLYHIGKQYNMNWRLIGHFNHLENLNVVHEGQELRIPPSLKELNDMVDVLNKWYESKDKSDVAELSVAIESCARHPDLTMTQLGDVLAKFHILSELDLMWQYHLAGRLLTISWFIGDFPGEWRKYLNAETK